MNIILLKDIPGIGKCGDIKQVKAGYAAHFLIPRKLAVPATAAELAKVTRFHHEQEKRDTEELQNLQAQKKKIETGQLAFVFKTDTNGSIFNSISAQSVRAMLAQQDIEVRKDAVAIPHAIREPGIHTVTISLGREVTATLTINATVAET